MSFTDNTNESDTEQDPYLTDNPEITSLDDDDVPSSGEEEGDDTPSETPDIKGYLDFAGLSYLVAKIKAYISACLEPYAQKTVVTSEVNGLMLSSDKSKLDGVANGATAVSVSTELTEGTKIGSITVNGVETELYTETVEPTADIESIPEADIYKLFN